MNPEPTTVEQNFQASIETVWKAITNLEQMRQWYFPNIPEFERESGQAGWDYLIKQSLPNFISQTI